MNLYQVAEEISRRLAQHLPEGTRTAAGRSMAATKKFQEDPHWRDYVQFYEYFHGDNGAGLGASHQTGWTGVIARAMHLFATTTAEQVLELGKNAAAIKDEPAPSLDRKPADKHKKIQRQGAPHISTVTE